MNKNETCVQQWTFQDSKKKKLCKEEKKKRIEAHQKKNDELL